MDTSHHAYERLTPDLVMDAVEKNGFRCDARILALNSYENRVFQIGLEEGPPIIAKFYRPERWTDEQILEEHRFTQELYDAELPAVPPMLLKPMGTTLTAHEGFRFALYERKGGRAPELDDDQSLLILGRFIARIHAVGATAPFLHRPELTIASYGNESCNYLLEHNFIPTELLPAYESITTELIAKITRQFAMCKHVRKIRLHGDCHMGNVLWRDSTPHFVDFDDARTGPALQDIWMMLSGDRNQQTLQIKKILEGYNEFYDFDPIELNLVEALRSLRIMYHCGWIARRWSDPAFPRAFPWFDSQRYWSDHILELREQLATMDEPALELFW